MSSTALSAAAPPVITNTLCACLLALFLLPTLCACSAGDASPIFRHCLAACVLPSSPEQQALHPLHHHCPIKEPTAFAWWAREHCFRCRQSCIWRTVDEFGRRSLPPSSGTKPLPPQFFGKWPFIPLILRIGPLFVPVQEPASVFFSLLNLCSVVAMQKRIRRCVPTNFHCRNEWVNFGWPAGMAWLASAIFHLCDHRITEAMDYGAALGLILYTFYASICFVLSPPVLQLCCPIQIVPQRLKNGIGIALSVFYMRYLLYIFGTPRFDYGWHIRCCVILSMATVLLFLAWAFALTWLGRAHLHSLRILATTFLLGWFSASFDVFFDFPPLFWLVDAHALFHLFSIPVPMLWANFICAEAAIGQKKRKEKKIDWTS
ncbi:hypothetical protein niasHS_005307 [Heterodera schachtii]|uniref:Post-GPI attachment to proteins factor 3 n=1 Tax=Heterodera schachtii TaxID=97005 RepID=A0ABD2J984_HETSC